jgi:hypothetical protein
MTNIRLTWYSGSDTYLYTLGKELIKRGHKVSICSSSISPALQGKRFLDAGFTLLEGIENKLNLIDINDDFDVIHGQHNFILSEVSRFLPKIPVIFISHGVLPQPEKYPKDVDISRFIGVSEEVVNFQFKDIDESRKEVIRNPIDTDRFYLSQKEVRGKLKILVSSNYFHNEWEGKEVWEAARELNAELEVIGTNGKMLFETERLIKECNIGIGLGRSILEIMSMGKPAIVGDYNGYDGVITPTSYEQIKLCNFSGRTNKEKWDGKKLTAEIKNIFNGDYQLMGRENRELILKNHNIEVIADRFEEIYNQIKV